MRLAYLNLAVLPIDLFDDVVSIVMALVEQKFDIEH
jgi:hypothetical protein